MKILDLQMNMPTGLLQPGAMPRLAVATDSATVLPGRPLFINDTSASMALNIALGLKIGRPGKSIPARYWSRHVDSVTLIAHVYPRDIDPMTAWSSAVDFSYAPGEWIPLAAVTPEAQINVISPVTLTAALPTDETIGASIACLSRYFTLKTGDIVIVPPPALSDADAVINTRVTAAIDSHAVLSFNLK